MNTSRSSLSHKAAACLSLVLLAGITQAGELAPPLELPSTFSGVGSVATPDERYSEFSSWPTLQSDYSGTKDAGNIGLFRVPLFGQISGFGVRVANANGGDFDGLSQQSLYIDFKLPWTWSPWEGMNAVPRFTLEVGQFETDLENRRFGSFGLAVQLDSERWRIPVFADFGFSPTFIDGSNYGDQNFGTSLNFTSHLALGIRYGRKSNHSVSVRYQHISNSGINSTNPGVNMFGIDLTFFGR